MKLVVVVQEHDVLAPGAVERRVGGGCDAAVLVPEHHLDPRVEAGEGAELVLESCVPGGVVGEEELEAGEALGEHRGHAALERPRGGR